LNTQWRLNASGYWAICCLSFNLEPKVSHFQRIEHLVYTIFNVLVNGWFNGAALTMIYCDKQNVINFHLNIHHQLARLLVIFVLGMAIITIVIWGIWSFFLFLIFATGFRAEWMSHAWTQRIWICYRLARPRTNSCECKWTYKVKYLSIWWLVGSIVTIHWSCLGTPL